MTLSGVKKRTRKRPSCIEGLVSGSRFVTCPLCGATLPWHQINEHIDAVHQALDELPGPTASLTAPERETQSPNDRAQLHTPKSPSCVTSLQPPQARWWQCPATLPPVLASGKQAGSKKQIPLTDDQLRSLAPCEIVRNALPSKLADQVLQLLLHDSASFKRGTWYIGGRKRDAPRTSSYYKLQETAVLEEASSVSKDVSADVQTEVASAELQEAATIVNQHVNSLSDRVQHELTIEDRGCWKSSYVLCNMYKDGQEGVGPHADRLTMLGPRPIIASLSLGATRTFRIRCQAVQSNRNPHSEAPQGATQLSHITQDGKAACKIGDLSDTAEVSHDQALVSADVQLPHNTLVIMWPPMQETWKHEVPKTKNVDRHHVGGTQRINLTFRRQKREWAERAPDCRCSQKAVMKASLPSSSGPQQRYYYACDNTQGPGCGYFQWATLHPSCSHYRPSVT